MKNTATTGERSAADDTELPAAWRAAIEGLEQDGLRRGAAPRTRRAYAVDAREFARWASARGLEPHRAGDRDIRRYAAWLSGSGRAPSSVARKLAALRALFRSLMERGRIEHNPAELLRAPKR